MQNCYVNFIVNARAIKTADIDQYAQRLQMLQAVPSAGQAIDELGPGSMRDSAAALLAVGAFCAALA